MSLFFTNRVRLFREHLRHRVHRSGSSVEFSLDFPRIVDGLEESF